MKRLQSSVLALILVVAVCAMAFTALRTGSKLWYSVLYTFTTFLLMFAVLAARFRRGDSRAFWFGFAVFGWGFFLLGLGPWMNPYADDTEESSYRLNPSLLTSKVILYLVPYLRKDANDVGGIDQITENTIGISHLLLSLTLAGAGGITAAVLRRRPRGTMSTRSLALLAGLALVTSFAVPGDAVRPRNPHSPAAAPGKVRPDPDRTFKAFSKYLGPMGEPSLRALARPDRDATVYRLLWLPTFHHPVCVRIERTGAGARLSAKVLDGKGGYHPGRLAIERDFPSAGAKWEELDRHLQRAAFWDLPGAIKGGEGIADGDLLLVEGLKGNTYHVVHRRCCDPAFEVLCREMLKMTDIEMQEVWKDYHSMEPSAKPD